MAITAPRVDLYYSGEWHDITSDVRYSGGGGQAIQIERGRANEQGRVGPSRCSLTLDNRTGAYSPRLPTSSRYGLIGRNTPLRVAVPILTDAFGRTSASGWGNTDTGQAWTSSGGDANDYTVGSGVGSIAIDTAGSLRTVSADTVSWADVVYTATIAPTAVATGDTIQISLVARRADANNYYRITVVFDTDSTWDLVLSKVIGGSATVLDSTTGISSYGAGTSLRVQVTMVGDYLHGRAYDLSNVNLSAEVYVADTSLTAAGAVGITAALGASTSLALPHTVTVDNVQLDDMRCVVEVPAWPVHTDTSGSDITTPIEAAGIMRRLGSGGALRSAMARAIPNWGQDINIGTLRAYWPCEDESGATQAASRVAGGAPMISSGTSPTVTFAAGSGPDGSDDLPSITGSAAWLIGQVGPHTVPTEGGWWAGVAFKGAGTSINVLEVRAAGTLVRWRMTVTATEVTVTAADSDGTTHITATATAACLDGAWHWLMMEAYQATSTQVTALVYVDGTATGSASDTTHTLGSARTVSMPGTAAPSGITSAYGGHVCLWSMATSAESALNLHNNGADMDALRGHAGETAGARMRRLAGEEGISLAIVGAVADTSPVGIQRIAGLMDLFQDAADADLGILYEPRQVAGLAYRTRIDLYNQAATLALTYSSTHLSGDLQPVDDDQLIRNDVTVSRMGGSSARHTVTTGALSTAAPPSGVGTYDDQVSVNVQHDVQLDGVAQWLAHLGTWDEARYPQLEVELHRAPYTASAALSTQAATADLGDMITVASPPAWLPPDTIKVLVQGGVENLDQFQRKLAWNCVPAGPWTVGVLDDATLGLLGSDGSTTAASFVAGTDTSLSVAVATGYPLWTTGTVDFDIMVAGVRLEVTNISGASSPQTFTVTQTAVNGVAKTIPSGSTVDLFTRAYIGL